MSVFATLSLAAASKIFSTFASEIPLMAQSSCTDFFLLFLSKPRKENWAQFYLARLHDDGSHSVAALEENEKMKGEL
jgi:hypothetical protein